MTVIIVGPILLALGVSYGLHITNRYAEETGTKDEKIRQSLASTGRAVFLSAVTTVIGFISLTFTNETDRNRWYSIIRGHCDSIFLDNGNGAKPNIIARSA